MSLERAGAVRVRIPFRAPLATATGTWHLRDAWIVRLCDADGNVGIGEANLDPAADDAALERLAAAVRAWQASGQVDPSGLEGRAVLAAIEAARLDLWAIALDGGPVTGLVAVNATIAPESTAASVTAARDAVARGYTTLKLKGGLERSTADLVERLTEVREAVGPGIALRLDVNGAWDAATARERLAALSAPARLDLEYVEQPIPAGDLEALAALRAVSPVRIAADESVDSLDAARAILHAEAADVVVVKPGRVGGPINAIAIAREAAAAGVGVTISTLLDTGVGLTAALRVAARLGGGVHGLATADVLESDLLATPLAARGGRIFVPAGPGTMLDQAAIERYSVERAGDAP